MMDSTAKKPHEIVERDYSIAAHMIHSLGIASVQLMTDNPEKIAQLEGHGVRVARRLPHVIPPHEHNRFHLETKAGRSGHWIDFKGKVHLPEQSDAVIVRAEGDA